MLQVFVLVALKMLINFFVLSCVRGLLFKQKWFILTLKYIQNTEQMSHTTSKNSLYKVWSVMNDMYVSSLREKVQEGKKQLERARGLWLE